MHFQTRILVLTGLFILGFITAILFGTKKEKLKVGSQMPELKYYSINDSGYIRIKNKPLMIMYFKSDCPHCEYELEIFNKMSEKFNDIDVICITTEHKFIANRSYNKWNNLATEKNFVFASVNEEEYRERFGIKITPLFLF